MCIRDRAIILGVIHRVHNEVLLVAEEDDAALGGAFELIYLAPGPFHPLFSPFCTDKGYLDPPE